MLFQHRYVNLMAKLKSEYYSATNYILPLITTATTKQHLKPENDNNPLAVVHKNHFLLIWIGIPPLPQFSCDVLHLKPF